MTRLLASFVFIAAILATSVAFAGDDTPTVALWPNQPPKWTAPKEPEGDLSKPGSQGVAGRPVVRLSNVSTPELHVFPAEGSKTTVIVCPGGGFSILAWDLEGIEVAKWLQQNGVSAVVLKYRVPTRNEEQKWLPPVQDLQRSIALVRSGAIKSLQAEHVGILGFSAGGHTAARTALSTERLYQPVDRHDQVSPAPDFAALVYPAYLTESKESEEIDVELKVTGKTPPMFFAHAFDDSHTCWGSLGLFAELKRHNVPSSLHVFSAGGHGFGARDTDAEKDQWLPLMKAWLRDRGF